MNFEDFTTIMSDLETKKYIKASIHKDHCIIDIKQQNNKKTTKLIENKIINDIWDKKDFIGGIAKSKVYNERFLVFVNGDRLIEALREENYEKIRDKINKLDISFIKGHVFNEGIQKGISINIKNSYHNSYRGNRYSFESDIKEILKEILPFEVKGNLIKTKKATEWERKKMNCEEIKICEDFDEILSHY